MNEDDSIAATSLDWATVVLKESEPPPARPAEDGLMTVLLGVVVLSIGGAILTAIPLLLVFRGGRVVRRFEGVTDEATLRAALAPGG